jgi:putative transposase
LPPVVIWRGVSPNHAAKAWKMQPREWVAAKTQFAIIFDERFVTA